ncbi:hypothetical protein ACNOYE_10540 [Nannocystaceae bacterium ST9]
MTRASFAPVCLVFALGCTPSTSDDDDVGGDSTDEASDSSGSDSTDGSDTTAGDTTTTDTGVEPLATVTGTVLDMQGAVLPSPGIQLCGPIDAEGVVESCIPVQVDDAAGTFEVGAMKTGLWALKCVHGPVDGRNFTGQSFQITIAEGDELDFSAPPIVIPEVADVTDVAGVSGMTDIPIDDVLTLHLDPSLAQTPDFTAPSVLGGLAVDAEFWRVSEVEGAPVIAAWSFTPFGTHATEGSFGFSLDGALGLATGDAVIVYGIQKDNGMIHEVATGTVNADATAIDLAPTADPLHELAWLLVTAG